MNRASGSMNVNGPRSSSATRNRQRANAREGLEMFNRLME